MSDEISALRKQLAEKDALLAEKDQELITLRKGNESKATVIKQVSETQP